LRTKGSGSSSIWYPNNPRWARLWRFFDQKA